MITSILNSSCNKILTLLSLSPGSRFNRKEIQIRTKLNNVPLDKALSILTNSNILRREKNYYFYNIESEEVKIILNLIQKQFKSLKELPLDVYYSILDLIDFVITKKEIEVFLFGSYAKLLYSEKSDIDIAILSDKSISKQELSHLTEKLESVYKKQIELHYFNKKDFYKNKSDPLIKSILKDGIRLI